jgi:hypothetical protein
LSSAAPALTELVDEAEEVVLRVMAPWTGLLWLTALPYRLLVVHFVDRLFALGDEAVGYGDHLEAIAAAVSAALVLWLAGRVIFVRACREALRHGARPGREVFRIEWGSALTYLYAALVIEILFVASAWMVAPAPIFILLSGLAAALSGGFPAAALVAPWREIGKHLRHPALLLGTALLFTGAFAVALVNLFFLFAAGAWLAGAWPGVETGAWDGVLSHRNRSFWLVLMAGAALVVEPFWLGTLTVHVQRAASRETGEDLRTEWQRVRTGAAS